MTGLAPRSPPRRDPPCHDRPLASERPGGRPAPARLAAALVLIAAMLAVLPGCNIFAASPSSPPSDKKVDVDAAYRGLAGQRIGVLVAADDATFFRFPQATRRVNEAVVIGLANALPEATLLTPDAAQRLRQAQPLLGHPPPRHPHA